MKIIKIGATRKYIYQEFTTMSVSGNKLRSFPVLKLCMFLATRHADCGKKPICRCFCPSSHKPWRQHFSRWWCLCPTDGIHYAIIILVWFISYSSGNSFIVNFRISGNKLLSFSLSWQICFSSLDNPLIWTVFTLVTLNIQDNMSHKYILWFSMSYLRSLSGLAFFSSFLHID